MTESTENAKPEKKKNSRKIPVRTVLLIGGAFFAGFVILSLIAVRVWDYSNSPAFCANVCHTVHPEESITYQDSYHAKVQCTECHMGRVSMLQNIFLKASHVRHIPEALFGVYDRPLESYTLRPANESCELCHWAPAHQGNQVLEIRRFLPDEENTEKRDYLILKIGGGEKDPLNTGMGYGIHWHALNTVEYIATDEERQEIPWVRATMPDGRRVEYNDVTNTLAAEEIAEAEIHIMDCVDCHNRVGHPFPPPGETIHGALAEGLLDSDLPFIKKEMLALLTASYGSQEEALEAVEAWEAQYQASYPEVAASKTAEIEQAAELARGFFTRLVFETPGITWESFPDQGEHKESPGCFRCHDGKHLSTERESIRLHCNICHSIPVTVDPGGSPPAVPAAELEEPPSHLEANFMADHRFQASDECVACHGEIAFGSDDSSFCADSSCHGRAWPAVALDAAFPHPVELEGKHAEAWCHDCHGGERKPEYVCSNCHEPPPAHFGPDCEDCHTPAGFEEADMGDFEHPLPLENAHANAECADCHMEGAEITADCSSCHEPPEAHLPGECADCHTPEGFAQSAASVVDAAPEITHALEGRDDCLMCHDPEGQTKPAPSNHADYQIEQCMLCHRTE